jgi:hypothetical protein
MNRFCLICLFYLILCSAHGQALGLKASFGISQYLVSGSGNLEVERAGIEPAFLLGAVLSLPIKKNELGVGLMLSRRSAEVRFKEWTANLPSCMHSIKFRMTDSFVQILLPISYNWQVKDAYQLKTGAFLGFGLSGNTKINGSITHLIDSLPVTSQIDEQQVALVPYISDRENLTSDAEQNYFKGVEAGLSFGLNVKLAGQLSLDLDYLLGLTTLPRPPLGTNDPENTQFLLHSMTLGLSYRLNSLKPL